MKMAEVIFDYKSNITIIQCNINDKMKDIIDKFLLKIEKKEKDNLIYLVNGSQLDKDLTFNEIAKEIDKSDLKMNIVVCDIDDDKNQKNEIISKDIICPECKEIENIFMDIKDFKINFYGCKNNHNINNIILNKYKKTQKIYLSKIICDICNKKNKGYTQNNKFYLCNTCNKNLCPLCNNIHDKNHIIIDYDDKNYICKKHNETFNKFCKKCNIDICMICENEEHSQHDIVDFSKILVNNTDLLKIKEDLKISIDKFKYKINTITKIFNRMVDIIDTYFKINNDIINNYKITKRNYYKLQNLYNLKNNNEIIITEINKIINNNKISEIYEFSLKNFYDENGEKYIGEIKNNLKDGKGVLIFNNDSIYEGDFKDNKREGKGILYYNDGDRYEGDWKNNIKEGKGIYYFKSGSKYEGDFKNGNFEGKGKYYYNNEPWKGDRYEGDFINDKQEGFGIYYYNNGDKYEGDWINGIKEGKGKFYYNNGDIFEGLFKNDKKEGKGILFYKNGKVDEGEWKNDEQQKKGYFYFW